MWFGWIYNIKRSGNNCSKMQEIRREEVEYAIASVAIHSMKVSAVDNNLYRGETEKAGPEYFLVTNHNIQLEEVTSLM